MMEGMLQVDPYAGHDGMLHSITLNVQLPLAGINEGTFTVAIREILRHNITLRGSTLCRCQVNWAQ